MANKRLSTVTSLRCDDKCVENTNSESLLSKLSVIESGYRVDPFLRIFRTNDQGEVKGASRSSAINRGYLARLIALEFSLEKYLLVYSSIGIKHQVLSLGAGYDSLYFRLRNQGVIDPNYCLYYEVDFPIVPYTKWRFIYNNVLLRTFFKVSTSYSKEECFSFDEGKFNMIGCNMTDTNALEDRLEALHFDWNLPTIVFCECSLTYVEASQSIALTSWLTRKISNMIFIDYEQIRPFDSFGKIMTRHFQNRNSALKCVEYYPSIVDHILDIDTVFRQNCGINEMKRRRLFGELFDEYEEFKSKCLHYILLVGSNSNLLTSKCLSLQEDKLNTQTIEKYKPLLPKYVRVYETFHFNLDNNIFSRLGHCVWHTPDNDVVIFGGYSQKTFRDSTLTVLGKQENGSFYLKYRTVFPSKETLFSAVTQLDNLDVYIFGGRSAPKIASNKLYFLDSYGKGITEVDCYNKAPESRWKHTLNALSSDRLVLIGGKNCEKCFSDVHIFDCKKRSWRLAMKLSTAIFSHSTCSWFIQAETYDTIAISGGMDEYENIIGRIQILAVTSDNKVNEVMFT